MAMIFALSIVPLLVTGGAGIDLARALVVRSKLYAAVDAAALAVGSKSGMSQSQANTLAQQYFTANFALNSSFGAAAPISVVISGQQVTVSSSISMPTTLMGVVGIQQINLAASSQVVWGQTKIWVGLALDNTGSMCEPSSQPCANAGNSTKIYALKVATKSLLTMFQNASATAGEVRVSLVPFVKDVSVGSSKHNEAWIDWTDWESVRGSCTITGQNTKSSCEATSTGSCNISGYNNQSACQNAGTCSISGYNTKSTCQAATVGDCSISGYTTQATCQSAFSGGCSINGYTTKSSCQNASAAGCSIGGYTTQSSCQNAGRCSKQQYTSKSSCQNSNGTWTSGVWKTFNGVWTVPTYGEWTTKASGVWSNGVWTSIAGTWTPDNHSSWNGCITDRGDFSGPSTPAYDTSNAAPGVSAASKFPAEQFSSCSTPLLGLSYDWPALSSKVDAMTAAGNTNQTIGLAWAWHSLSQGPPLYPPTLPAGTTRHIIILSDGENTQNRWTTNRVSIDGRMNTLCDNAKKDDVIIWSVFVNIAGTAGNAQSMKDCATARDYRPTESATYASQTPPARDYGLRHCAHSMEVRFKFFPRRGVSMAPSTRASRMKSPAGLAPASHKAM